MTKAEYYNLVAKALADYRTYSVINQAYINQVWYWKDFGVTPWMASGLGVNKDNIQLVVNISWQSISYDDLLNCEDLRLSSNNLIAGYFDSSIKLPSGLQLKCECCSYAYISKDDMDTLRDLGKVHTEVHKASAVETVVCPNV